MIAVPAEPGSYCLHLTLAQPAALQVGRLGRMIFPPGSYFYTGSAQGPGGLRSRLTRHVLGTGRPHWHIDALRQAAVVAGWGYSTGTSSQECAWAQALAAMPGARVPVKGFGASDCRQGCPAHLVHFEYGDEPKLENGVKWGDIRVWRII